MASEIPKTIPPRTWVQSARNLAWNPVTRTATGGLLGGMASHSIGYGPAVGATIGAGGTGIGEAATRAYRYFRPAETTPGANASSGRGGSVAENSLEPNAEKKPSTKEDYKNFKAGSKEELNLAREDIKTIHANNAAEKAQLRDPNAKGMEKFKQVSASGWDKVKSAFNTEKNPKTGKFAWLGLGVAGMLGIVGLGAAINSGVKHSKNKTESGSTTEEAAATHVGATAASVAPVQAMPVYDPYAVFMPKGQGVSF